MNSLGAHQSLDSEPLQLNCLVLRDDHSRVFPVKIAATKTVGTLKDAIKEKNKHLFHHVDTKASFCGRFPLPPVKF